MARVGIAALSARRAGPLRPVASGPRVVLVRCVAAIDSGARAATMYVVRRRRSPPAPSGLAAAALAVVALLSSPCPAEEPVRFDERGENVFFRVPDRDTARAIEELIGRFAEDSPVARMDSRRQLEDIGYWSVEPLHAALAEREAPIRAAAALTLSAILDPRSVEPLRAAVYRDTSNQFVSGFAAIGLARFRDPGAVEPLRTALRSSKSIPTLRAAAPFALARIRTPEARTVLMESVRSRSGPAYVKSARLLALGFFPDAAVQPDRPEPSEALADGLRSNRLETRGAAPLARQVAMYLVHVELGVTQTRIAAAFGRDRSTVGHACLAIEQRRDDPAFDDMMEALARIFRRLVLGPPGWLPLATAS